MALWGIQNGGGGVDISGGSGGIFFADHTYGRHGGGGSAGRIPGMFQSIHIDEYGNIIAVYNDGDNGVYVHPNGTTREEIDQESSENNNTGGIGVYIGETWTVLGFADFEKYEESNGKIIEPGEKAKIDFYSFRATKQVSAILSSDPTLLEYAMKARGGEEHDWDIKAHAPEHNVYYGSLLYGKYASARDAGNFAAGAVAQKSFVPNLIIDYGYGTYNLSGNSVRKSLLMITGDMYTYFTNPILGMGIMYYRAKYGENVLSRAGIEAGKMYIKNKGS